MPSPVLLPTTLSIPRWLKRVLLGFGLTFDLHASACLNEYQTLITGKVDMDIGQYCPLFRKDINKEELAAELRFLERLDLTNEQRSDKGALLIYLGRYEEAISLYQDLLDEGWNAYTVHSNLGTAYELIGRNDSALLHIKRALDIDPTSHKGSEWIHVKILEYKIAEATGEKFSSVLGLTFGNHAIPKTPEGIDPELFREQLIHQLEERMTFVHPKDPIVGELLFELGNVQALLNTVECAVDVYGLAKEYGFTTPIFNMRTAALSAMTGKARFLNAVTPASDQDANWITYTFYSALLLIPALLVWLLVKMLRKRQR